MMNFPERYNRNKQTITEDEQKLLAAKSVFVAGCGGLGGGIIENLTRLGIGRLTVIDGDSFDETNLNRQVLSHEGNLGHSKAVEAKLQMAQINSSVFVTSVQAMIDEENAEDLIAGHDIVVDALDNVGARMALEKACHRLNIPLVHGAIGGWNGQVAVSMPGSRLLHEIYGIDWEASAIDVLADTEMNKGEEVQLGNPSFTPAVVGSIQVAEVLKLLLNKEEALTNKLLVVDLLNDDFEVIEL